MKRIGISVYPDFDDIEKFNLVSEIPENAKKLAKHFWPGALTIIMKKSEL